MLFGRYQVDDKVVPAIVELIETICLTNIEHGDCLEPNRPK